MGGVGPRGRPSSLHRTCGNGPRGCPSRSVGILIETFLLFAFIPIDVVVIPPMMVH